MSDSTNGPNKSGLLKSSLVVGMMTMLSRVLWQDFLRKFLEITDTNWLCHVENFLTDVQLYNL